VTDSADELARQLEPYRDYLALLARLHMDRRWQGKIDLSGVIQQTLFEACRTLQQLPVTSEQHLPLLRRILANNLTDELRRLSRARRDVTRERAFQAALDQSSARLEAFLPDRQNTPSERLGRQEDLLRLTRALQALPDNQRQAVELHHLQGRPLAEVAEEMGCTRPAIAGLLHRALHRLRELLAEEGP
jgi:RNA polymerase sigma-70 factor (ECF subfamily)